MVTIVAIGQINATVNASLDAPDPGGSWTDLLSGKSYRTTNGVFENVKLSITTGPTAVGDLIVLLHML